MPTNLSLWVRVPLIIAPLIVRGIGQYMDARPVENVEGKGKSDTKPSYITRTNDILSRYSVLPAISFDKGVIYCDIIEGAFNTGTFYKLIECTLDHMWPYPAPNSVLVMDNCHILKHPTIQNLIETW